MSDRKPPRRVVPTVEVIRRPGAAPGESTPSAPAPRLSSGPLPRPPAPRTATPAAGIPSFRAAAGGPPPGRAARPSTPRAPPTAAQIQALAEKERVPARIARGELEGKMKCRIWKKLHAEEAKRFDQVYTLLGATPGLSLADGFGVVQSGLTVAEFLARKERVQRKQAIKDARVSVENGAIDAFIDDWRTSKTVLAVVLGERAVLDTLTSVEPISFEFERTGRVDKLQVVLLTRRTDWERRAPQLERDPKLSQKPQAVSRQPDKRPFSDPRPFIEHLGAVVRLTLRNGIQLTEPLQSAGRFDLILGDPGEELFVPLHAIVRFEVVKPAGTLS